MFFAKYSPYFIVHILSITGVLSTPQIQGIAKSDVGLSQEGDLDDLPPSQAISLAFQQDPNSLSDHSLSEVAASLQLAKTFSPDSETFSTLTPKLEFTPPIQNSALVALDENGGFTDVFPSFPSFPQLNILPQSGKSDPEIPSNTHTDSKTERKEPHCQHGKFAFCCQRGPPSRGANKVGISPDVFRERERERKSRLGKCKKWKIDDPACDFPENEACCTCVSKQQAAFFCYNPNGIRSAPQPVPLLTDPSPSEPDILDLPGEKRDFIETDSKGLFFAANPSNPSWKRPGGRPRFESTCSDEFLKNLGMSAGRHYKPSIHTPENPYKPKPKKEIPSPNRWGWDDGW